MRTLKKSLEYRRGCGRVVSRGRRSSAARWWRRAACPSNGRGGGGVAVRAASPGAGAHVCATRRLRARPAFTMVRAIPQPRRNFVN